MSNKIILVVALIGALVSTVFASGFGPAAVYPAGQSPVAATVDDVNHDGILDLLVLNGASNDLSVLIGNPDGSYQQAVNYGAGLNPTAMTIEDFDWDGNNDIAVADGGGSNISILFGNGDGTFRPAISYELGTGSNPQAIVWSILTSSGNVDLIVANSSGGTGNHGTVAVLLGNGDGTFQQALNYDTLGARPTSLVISQLRGSLAPLDIALANSTSNSVTVLFGDGKGGFVASGDYPVGSSPSSIAAVSFGLTNNLLVTNSGSNTMSMLFNDASGKFVHRKDYATGSMPVSIGLGLFNHDFLFDVAVVNQLDNTVSIYTRLTHLPTYRKPVTFPTCTSPKSVSVVDVNQDGRPDLVLACSNGAGVMLNTGK